MIKVKTKPLVNNLVLKSFIEIDGADLLDTDIFIEDEKNLSSIKFLTISGADIGKFHTEFLDLINKYRI